MKCLAPGNARPLYSCTGQDRTPPCEGLILPAKPRPRLHFAVDSCNGWQGPFEPSGYCSKNRRDVFPFQDTASRHKKQVQADKPGECHRGFNLCKLEAAAATARPVWSLPCLDSRTSPWSAGFPFMRALPGNVLHKPAVSFRPTSAERLRGVCLP